MGKTMITNAILFLILCSFAFIPLALGEYARGRSVLSTEDFFLQGRKLGLFTMYATTFATWMSAFAFMGGITYIYEQGPIYMTTIGWDALFAVLFVVLGRRIWHYGKVHHYTTPTDFFSDIYDSKALNLLVTAITVICTLVYLQVQIVGGLQVMVVATGGLVRWYAGGIIFFAILVIYLWAGGLRAIALTDIFYGVLMVTAILSSGVFLIKTAGGTEAVFTELIQRDPANVSMIGENSGQSALRWISLFIIVPTGAFLGPQIWIRNYAAVSEKNFNGLPLLLYISSIVCVGTLLAGSASIVMAEDASDPGTVLIQLLRCHAGPFFQAFIIVGIYASIFSTANSQIHALSTVYTVDIYRKYINNKAPDRKQVSVAKWMVLLVSVLSYILMILIPQSIFDLAIMAMGGSAQLLIPLLGALFWKRSTAAAAVAGLLCGEGAFFATAIIIRWDSSICGLLGMLVNLAFFIFFSLIDRPRTTVFRKIERYKREYRQRGY
ncbi:sodium:solute symporter family protein [Clostridiales bacterium]|nr:sodium:solute symporter family protein [Clostridiales bacterium]